MLDKPLTIEKREEALNSLPGGKSPGRDGFRKEFFTWGWSFIEPVFQEAVQQMFDRGTMCPNLNESLVTLLPKAKASEGVKYWRPISLLNTVYKIVSKALARRLAPLMDQWVSKVQRGFVQGRCILDNLMLVK